MTMNPYETTNLISPHIAQDYRSAIRKAPASDLNFTISHGVFRLFEGIERVFLGRRG